MRDPPKKGLFLKDSAELRHTNHFIDEQGAEHGVVDWANLFGLKLAREFNKQIVDFFITHDLFSRRLGACFVAYATLATPA